MAVDVEARLDELADKLELEHRLTRSEYEFMLDNRSDAFALRLAERAVDARKGVYGTTVFARGLVEFTNHCRNDCLYCGLRASNSTCDRYRLTAEEILRCCDEGYELGFRTFVLQGGEDPWYSDDYMCDVVRRIKLSHPDCAVTLSIGERSRESYAIMREAGADRYLLRHETAAPEHYRKLHPESMSFENRIQCLHELRELGYQIGAGFMVGTPFQTSAELACDLEFIEQLKPDMCGIGPFVPHHATPFAAYGQGTVRLTCYLLSILRLIYPNMLIPATTALGTIDPRGREKGILAGANVVMPNLSPVGVRSKYEIYDGKICTEEEAAECSGCLQARMMSIGYQMVVDRGDIRLPKEAA